MILKLAITIIIVTILVSCRLRHEDNSKADLFKVVDFDEAVIDFYYPDTIIISKDYENTYYNLCFLKPTDLREYFELLNKNDYQQCEELLNHLRNNSPDKSFANLLKARMHIHYIQYDIGLKSKINLHEIHRYNDVYYLLQMAGDNNLENELVKKLIDGIRPFLANRSLVFHEKMTVSEKLNTKVNILRLIFRNKNMEDLSNQYIINYLSLTGIDSTDNKRLEGLNGFDPTGRPSFSRDIPF